MTEVAMLKTVLPCWGILDNGTTSSVRLRWKLCVKKLLVRQQRVSFCYKWSSSPILYLSSTLTKETRVNNVITFLPKSGKLPWQGFYFLELQKISKDLESDVFCNLQNLNHLWIATQSTQNLAAQKSARSFYKDSMTGTRLNQPALQREPSFQS